MIIYDFIFYSIYKFINQVNSNTTFVSSIAFLSLVISFGLTELYFFLLPFKVLSFDLFDGYNIVILMILLLILNFFYFYKKNYKIEIIEKFDKETGLISNLSMLLVYLIITMIIYIYFTYALDELGKLRFEKFGIEPNETLK